MSKKFLCIVNILPFLCKRNFAGAFDLAHKRQYSAQLTREMNMIDKIITQLSQALDIYEKQIGYGFFTRRSRKETVKHLRDAIRKNNPADIIHHILNFASTMQGKNADVGYLGQSKLNSLLWGNHQAPARNGGIYQMLYDYLISPEGKKSYGEDYFAKSSHLKIPESDADYIRQIEHIIGYNWNGNHSLKRHAPIRRTLSLI